jgi:hypothetical protein
MMLNQLNLNSLLGNSHRPSSTSFEHCKSHRNNYLVKKTDGLGLLKK